MEMTENDSYQWVEQPKPEDSRHKLFSKEYFMEVRWPALVHICNELLLAFSVLPYVITAQRDAGIGGVVLIQYLQFMRTIAVKAFLAYVFCYWLTPKCKGEPKIVRWNIYLGWMLFSHLALVIYLS